MIKPIRTIVVLAALLAALAAVPAAAADADKPDKPKTRHPSYELLGPNPPPADSILNPNFLLSQESKVLEGTLWHGNYLPELLVGLDVADVDGDRRNEIVYATQSNVYLGRRQGDQLEQLATWRAPGTVRIVSVDLYDPRQGGRALIIVSAQGDQGLPSSYILSYEGSNVLKPVASHVNWYLRTVGPVTNKMLVAQKGANNAYQAYTGKVVQATVEGGKFTAGKPVALPFGVNLYNFNVGSVGPGGSNFIATVTFPEEHLKLFSGPSRGDQVTEKNAVYCGTTNFIKFKGNFESVQQYEYLPSRIVMADIDNDGGNEIIVARNSRSGLPFLKNMRSFDGGVIEAYKLTNISLVPFFTSTNMLPGPAVDYTLADLDNNGTKDLVVAVVINSGSGILTDSRSVIVSYSNLYTPAGGDRAQAK
jgi:hypothetical protein